MTDFSILLLGTYTDGEDLVVYPLNQPEGDVSPWRYPSLDFFEVTQGGKKVRVIHSDI